MELPLGPIPTRLKQKLRRGKLVKTGPVTNKTVLLTGIIIRYCRIRNKCPYRKYVNTEFNTPTPNHNYYN